MNKTVMRLILGIMLAGWMIIIFWFSNQPATESSEISGTISYRLVEDTDEIFNWGLTTDQIGNIAGNIEYPIRKSCTYDRICDFRMACICIFRNILK